MAWHPSDRFFPHFAGDQPATGLPLALELPTACAYCGHTEFDGPNDTGRGANATCQQCGGTMTSNGGHWMPELIGDPSNHPSPKVDPRSGAGAGQSYLVHPEGFEMMPPKESAFSMFEVTAASEPDQFHFQHEEINTGGTKFPRRVDISAHHPDTGEEAGRARYYPPKRKGGPLSIEEVRGHAPGAASALLNEIESRHPTSATKFLYEVKRNNNNPDVTGHAHERAGKPSDWDTHYPTLGGTVYRGASIRLPDRSARVVNSSRPKEDHLDELHSAIHGSLGMHWTEDEHAARLFAQNAVSDHRTDIPVVLHAKTPERKDIETREQQLYRGGVFPYGDPHSKENEVPVRKGRKVSVTGISWKPDAPHPDADEHGWIHHTYPEHQQHTAMMRVLAAEERPKYKLRQTVQTMNGYEDQEREIEGPLYHGGRANVRPGDHLTVGRKPNSWGDEGPKSTHNYFTTEMDTAASYAKDLGRKGRIYEVEPTGEFKQDYSHGDFKTKHPLRVVREVFREEWPGWAKEASAGTPSGKSPVDWDTVGSVYPHVYGDPEMHGEAAEHGDGSGIGYAVNHLAHDRPDDPGAENSSVHDLEFHPYKAVPTEHIDYVRHPPSDPRVQRAIEGYKTNPDAVPPLVLVHRHDVYHVADGHHRAAAAAYARVQPRALIAFSPHPNEPFSDGGRGPSHGAEPTSAHTAMPRRQYGDKTPSDLYKQSVFSLFEASLQVEADGPEQDYRIMHQAPDSDYGAPLHDVEKIMPDFYTHPHYYDNGQPYQHESVGPIMNARGNPEKKIKIYRALPAEHAGNGFNTGDWVTTSKSYAREHAQQNADPKHNWPVISTTVPAKHLHTEGDVHEWAYNGPRKEFAMLSHPGGYHQEVRQREDGTIKPVQRRPKKAALDTGHLGHGHPGFEGGVQHTAEADWCAHRRFESCYWPGDNPTPGHVPQRRGTCNWKTAFEQMACPMSDPGPLAGMFVKGSTDVALIREARGDGDPLLPVKHAGYRGYVEAYPGYHDETEEEDRQRGEPDPNIEPAHHQDVAPIASHTPLVNFITEHFENHDLWNAKGSVEDVDLKSGVYATQPYVVKRHLGRYRDNPKDQVDYIKSNGWDDEQQKFHGNHMPMFVRHGVEHFTIEGHHRTGAALQRGDTHIRGIVYDADKHGWPENDTDAFRSPHPSLHHYSRRWGRPIDCDYEHDSRLREVMHAITHHDDGICTATERKRFQESQQDDDGIGPRRGSKEPSALVPIQHAGFAGLVEKYSGDFLHMDDADREDRVRRREEYGSPGEDNHYPEERPKVAGTHREMANFRSLHQTDRDMWHKHGQVENVDLHAQPVYASQGYLAREHLDRYRKKPDDMGETQRKNNGSQADWLTSYPGTHMPMFIRHENNLFTTEGHHRVGAAFLRGDKTIRGMVYDADKHGFQNDYDHPDSIQGFKKNSSIWGVPVNHCEFVHDDDNAGARHAYYHHDDGVCVGTGLHGGIKQTAAIWIEALDIAVAQDPEVRLQFTATWADVRDKAKRIRHEGGVRILMASSEGVVGEVRGDNAVYETTLSYVPGSARVGYWHCGCAWAAYAWGRSPKYRRFEGRFCSHALALQYESMSRSAHGREIGLDVERPGWLKQRTPVVIQHQRDPALDLTRREVPPGNMRRVFSSWEMPVDDFVLGLARQLVDGQPQHIASAFSAWDVPADAVGSDLGRRFVGGYLQSTAANDDLHMTVQRALDNAREEHELAHQDDATYAENYEPLKNSDVPEEHHGGWRFHRNVEGAPPVANMFADLFGAQKEHQHMPPVPVTQYRHPVGREPLHLDEHGNSYRRHYEWTSSDARVPEFKGWSGPHSAKETLQTHPTWSQSFDEHGNRRHHMRSHQERLEMMKTEPTDDHDEVVMRRNRNLREQGWGVVGSRVPGDGAAEVLVGSRVAGRMQHIAKEIDYTKQNVGDGWRYNRDIVGETHVEDPQGNTHKFYDWSHPGLKSIRHPDHMPVPLYHGTNREIPEGAQIEPGHPGNFVKRMKHVYLVDNPEEARNYAGPRGTVYEVQPTGVYGHRSDAKGHNWATEHPVNVVRVHSGPQTTAIHHLSASVCPECHGAVAPSMKNCPHCGAALMPTDAPDFHLGANQKGLPTVAGIVLKALDTGRILMLQRGLDDEKDPARGTWEFPGGHVEDGDVSTVHAAIREWQEEVGQPFPEGAAVLHSWVSPNGIYAGYVAAIPEERQLVMSDGRVVPNPDDPKGDFHEQAAWWSIEHARKNPALRPECKSGTPWKEIERAGTGVKAARAELMTGLVSSGGAGHAEDIPLEWWPVVAGSNSGAPMQDLISGLPHDPPAHSNSQNPASTGFATSEDPEDWTDPQSSREDLRVGSWRPHEGFDAWRARLGDDLLQRGIPHPQHDRLYRAVSDNEMQVAKQKGAFHSLDNKGLFVSDDPDRLAGGAYGGKDGGHIIEIDPSKVSVGERPSYYNRRLVEKAADHVPMHAVTRSWTWNDEAQDHLPSDVHRTAMLHNEPEPALPSTDGEREDPLPAGTPAPATDAETMPYGYDDLTEFGEDHPEVGSTPGTRSLGHVGQLASGSVHTTTERIVAEFQRTAGAQALASNSPRKGDDQMDIAAAARAYLDQGAGAGTQRTALKDFSPEERAELINEGAQGVTARNLQELQIEGTHYSALEATLCEHEKNGEDAADLFIV